MLTDDENIIDIQFAVQYNSSKSAEALRLQQPPARRRSCSSSPSRRCARSSARRKMDFVLYEGREQIAAQTRDADAGVARPLQDRHHHQKVTLQNAQPPDQVQAAFDDAVKASQDRERLKNEGQAYANDVCPRRAALASRLLRGGRRLQHAVIAQRAEGDASRFHASPRRIRQGAAGVTRDRLYLDTMQSVLATRARYWSTRRRAATCSTCRWTSCCSRAAPRCHAGRCPRPGRARTTPAAPEIAGHRSLALARRPAQPGAVRGADEARRCPCSRCPGRAAARGVAGVLHGRPDQVRDHVPAGRDRRDQHERRPLLQAARWSRTSASSTGAS